MTSTPVYVTPDGRTIPIPAELAAKTKFTKRGVPDRRCKDNVEFEAWAEQADKFDAALTTAQVQAGEESNGLAQYLAKSEPKVEGADCVDCGQAVGHYDDCPVGMGVDPSSIPVVWTTTELKADGPVVRETVWLNPETHSALQSAQAYALRVWNGQSPEVHREERLRRVKLALDGQGLSMEGVEL